ncbi:MAG: HAD family hydrolase [Bacillota bacterium]
MASDVERGLSQREAKRRLASLGRVILISCVLICASLVGLGLWRSIPFHEVFLTGVSLAVAAVPEGLPAVVTLSFAFGVQRIAMEVVALASPEDLAGMPAPSRIHAGILQVAVLAKDARSGPGGSESTGEDPTEQAIVGAAQSTGLNPAVLDQRFPRLSERPFTPERRMMSVKVATREGALICAKGASDTVIPACRTQLIGGKVVTLGEAQKEAWTRWVESQASRGMRTLAVAKREDVRSGKGEDYAEEDLCLLGCLSMADPLRPEARSAVEQCMRAGIRPVLITGDHLLTAESVALKAGILRAGEKGMTGQSLEDLGRDRPVDARPMGRRVPGFHISGRRPVGVLKKGIGLRPWPLWPSFSPHRRQWCRDRGLSSC